MKLYILRHEERNKDNPLFFSELTELGLNNSIYLIKKLLELDIDIIYASPFLRVVQTIYPYCIQTNTIINIDNSLYESMDNELFNNINKNNTWKQLPSKYKQIINHNYKPIYNDVKLYETFDDVCKRVLPFINKLKLLNKNALIITHKTVCNAILNIFDNTIKDDSSFEMGEFKEIFL